ncbi:MAG: sugar transferase [Sphingomonas sp.]|jgi:lipopolysaccharide/colanic/teichoic acid biosynthesis glycosyltransferase|uniref:sugar transferase n=1 Tax=Sphingomonas sp. TaxID=28214 RepID=UPI0035678947
MNYLSFAAHEQNALHADAPVINDKRPLRLRCGILLIGFDLVAILVAVVAATVLRFGTGFGFELGRLLSVIVPIYLVVAANGHAFQLGEAVHDAMPKGRNRALMSFIIAMGLILGAAFYLGAGPSLSRFALALSTLFGLLSLAAARRVFARFSRRWFPYSILHETIIMDGVPVPAGPDSVILDAALLGLLPRRDDPTMLDRLGRRIAGTDRVIIACPPERRRLWSEALRGTGVNVEIIMPELDAMRALGINNYGGHTTTMVSLGHLSQSDRGLKRSLDLAIVFITLPVTLLLMSLAALAVRLESPGPVFFVQRRIGQGNRLFAMYKFRSMRSEASDRDGAVSTLRGDDRVTRVGRFIRRTSLDELPQLFNVLRGEMSIVGPRPHALESRAEDALFWDLEQHYWDRHAVKPGMTGLAQVRGYRGSIRHPDELASRVDSDLAYLQSWSIWRDIAIIGRTFRVLVHDNAF